MVGPDGCAPNAIAINQQEDIITTGYFEGAVDFNPDVVLMWLTAWEVMMLCVNDFVHPFFNDDFTAIHFLETYMGFHRNLLGLCLIIM